MWPIVLGKVVAGAALAVGALTLWRHYEQQQERQQTYWEPFEVQQPKTDDAETAKIKDDLLKTVKNRLLEIQKMAPGRARSAAIRELRARYHPDRHAHLPMLAKVFEEVSTLINTRTDPLLEEDCNQS